MAITRVVATLPFFSLDSKDVATNTFHFSTVATPDSAERLAIAARLDAFYSAIDLYLSPVISQSLCTYKFFDLADPPPRVPVETIPTVGLTFGTNGLPEEVAICLSYLATPVSGEPIARRRGRIYLGPLSTTAIGQASSSAFTRISSATRTALGNAAAVLADQSEASQWCVYSPTDGIARQIKNGYVDDAADTQRRRGRVTTARTIWTGQA